MIKEKFEATKEHVKRNKVTYITGGVCLLVGASGGTLFAKRTSVVTAIQGIAYKSPIITQMIIPALGDPGNVVQCVETGTIYASQGQAARELGVTKSDVSKHINGTTPHIRGKHLTKLGKAGLPIDVAKLA